MPKKSFNFLVQNITVSSCGLKPVEAGEAETLPAEEGGVDAERKRRDAEADPLLLYGAAPLVPAPVVPLLKHVCEEIQQEYCYPETKVVDEKTTVKRCLVRMIRKETKLNEKVLI